MRMALRELSSGFALMTIEVIREMRGGEKGWWDCGSGDGE